MENVEYLYPTLVPTAQELCRKVLHGFALETKQEIAHDITVDFLYFSRSFRETFNPSRGSVNSFFYSYVQRKLKGVIHRTAAYLNKVSHDEKVLKECMMEEEVFSWREFMARLDYFHDFLVQHAWKTINLGVLFRHILFQYFDKGKLVKRDLKTELHTSNTVLSEALIEMKRLLNERIKDGY